MRNRIANVAILAAFFIAGTGLWLTGALLQNARAADREVCTVPSAGHATIQNAIDDPTCDVVTLLAADYEGGISIHRSVRIDGQGPAATTVSGQGITRSFTIESGAGPVTLTAMTIRQGNANHGGGVYHAGHSLLLSATAVISNSALRGGGVYVAEGGELAVVDTTFRGNESTYGFGGAVMAIGAEINIRNTLFEENESVWNGGAIRAQESQLALVDSALRANTAGDGGGAIDALQGTLLIQNSDILDNVGNSYGGAILVRSIDLTISETLFAGNQAGGGGALYLSAYGTANLFATTFTANQSYGSGGAIVNYSAALTLTDSTFNQNSTEGMGGGLYNFSIATTRIERTTFAQNQSLGDSSGGGVANEGGELTIVDTLLHGNTGGYAGGGVYSFSGGTLRLVNSTLSGNASEYGGAAIFVDGDSVADVENSTIVSNFLTRADLPAGAIFVGGNGSNTLRLANSIIAGNENQDCSGDQPITSLGHNVDGDGSCNLGAAGDVVGVNALVGPLQDNGGPTWTHALLPGSPAIDGGDDAICPATDQRGAPRPFDGDGSGVAQCDIGAVEAQFVTSRFLLPVIFRQ